MPDRKTLERAAEDKAEGKSPSTQAGEFVREEMEHVREGKHGARSAKQAIAIGLSKARRAGVALKAPAEGEASAETRQGARRALAAGAHKRKTSARRSRATTKALEREGSSAASPLALSRQAKAASRKRGPTARSAAARKAARTRARNKS